MPSRQNPLIAHPRLAPPVQSRTWGICTRLILTHATWGQPGCPGAQVPSPGSDDHSESAQHNCLPHSHSCTSAEVPRGGRSGLLTPAGPGESPVSTPEARFPEWAELWQIIFPPLRVITSSKFHHPSGSLIAFYTASGFYRLLPCPIQSRRPVWLGHGQASHVRPK